MDERELLYQQNAGNNHRRFTSLYSEDTWCTKTPVKVHQGVIYTIETSFKPIHSSQAEIGCVLLVKEG